jgi:hypothetical protein
MAASRAFNQFNSSLAEKERRMPLLSALQAVPWRFTAVFGVLAFSGPGPASITDL